MKTVIITGTSAGIGYKLSQIFSDKKFKVISLSRSSNITEISSKNIEHISFDITSEWYEVGIHIADVSHYVKPNTKLDTEAYNIGTSVI